MLRRARRDIFFECDDCGDILDTFTDDFEEAREYLIDNDWQSKKENEVWHHYCFSCAEGIR